MFSGGNKRITSRASARAACQIRESSPAFGTGPSNSSSSTSRCEYRADRRLLQDRPWAEPGVLAARRPGQVAERLKPLVALDHVDPVADLDASDQGQDLVGRGVEGMEREAQHLVAHQREEALDDPTWVARDASGAGDTLEVGRPAA